MSTRDTDDRIASTAARDVDVPDTTDIAIVGMAARFPGARDIDEYWRNLCDGVESVTYRSKSELVEAGLSPEIVADDHFVPAVSSLSDYEMFDAAFFGYQPREAELMDPQHRVLLECAWTALEDAGYRAGRPDLVVGTYVGAAANTYLLFHLSQGYGDAAFDQMQVNLGNADDFLATRISYKLNLTGPSLAVRTACSTSLVAVHLACQALSTGECDVALAGGATVNVSQASGYRHVAGGILSPDGHCRAFDARAAGTIFGSGVGVVVLKRLSDARAAGDNIVAVIKGSAINNDGALKAGYTAPSVTGQTEAIAEAYAVAGISPRTIEYVEAHGTATAIGDPIEIEALTKAFRAQTGDRHFCALGSVKTNIGHLDAAAGIAGLIKAALAVKHGRIPPSLHFSKPNPAIEFASSPFYVNTVLKEWRAGAHPRRAAVSAFGIGGTNAHVVLEEPPAPRAAGARRTVQLVLLSARTAHALEASTDRLRRHLQEHPDLDVNDVAYTLQVGRQSLPHRRAIVCRSRAELSDLLADPQRLRTSIVDEQTPAPVAFLFPGQGAQYVQMARGLYDHEPFLRTEIDRYCSILEKHVGRDIRPLLFAPAGDRATAEQELVQTAVAQPALFVVELALAQLLLAWGIRPDMALGHSLGEYVAACVSGVMSTEDALAIVAARGRVMGALPPGGMVAVPLGEDRLAADLGGALAIAAVNAPAACVVSGPLPEIAEFERQMAAKGVRTDRLQTSHAFHSPMMQAAADALARTLSAVRLEPPRIPFASNVTGTWITAADATNPAYWARQLVAPTRIADGLARLLERNAILLEVGPGHALSTLAELQRTATRSVAVPLMRGARQQDDDVAVLWEGLGRAWLVGVDVDWAEAHSAAGMRVRLPTYPFERQRHWIERTSGAAKTVAAASTGERDAAPVTPHREHRGERSISGALKDVVSQVCGIESDTIDVDAPFAQLGLNSMLLLQVNQAVHDRFHVDVPLRQYFEECSTISALAAYVEQQAPGSGATLQAQPDEAAPTPALAPAADGAILNPPPATSAVEQQLASISRQLDFLLRQSTARVPSGGDAAVPVVSVPDRPVASSTVPGGASSLPVAEATPARQPFTPYTRLNLDTNPGFARRQREHVEKLIARYTARTARSRAAIESGRRVLANNRTVAGFRLALKEITYPIVVREAAGSTFLDVDGNEYVDISMGFGAYLFGHNAPFINAAVTEELKRGAPIGPFSHEAGHVARRICELTDVERVAFFNTGTEAVMVAVRLARARTGRSKIALFAGSFHGTFDGILARPRLSAGGMGSAPMAPGVPEHMTDQVLVLEYGSQAALEAIAANGHDLAAVLVEPVQSRRPEFQPADFLRQLRDVTRQTGSALIFDEMITGFRIAPGGVQAHFGVRADLVTYGKVVGGGMPIGVVAGASPFMDGIDGGVWTFGDRSYPPNEERRTFVAGTFCQHPLAMSAAAAVLDHLTSEGPALQRGLNERAERLTSRLNAYLSQTGVPLHMVSFGSLFRFVPRGDLELLFYHLVDKGIYIWEGRNCFLSTAHTEDDLDRIVGAVQASVEELREGGFLPPVAEPRRPEPQPEPVASRAVVAAPSRPEPPILVALTDEQKQLWVLTQLSPEASAAYNEGVALRLHGPIDMEALRWALEQLYRRHEALRTTIEPDGETQRVAPSGPFEVGLVDFTHRSGGEAIAEWLAEEGSRPFDLAAGPLVRAFVLTLGEHDHLFVFVVHHIIADDWSRGVLLKELGTLYSARRAGTPARLPEPIPFRDYIAWQQKQLGDDTAPAVRGRAFWEQLFAGAPSRFDLPMDRPRPTARYFPGARLTWTLPSAVAEALAQLAAQRNATPFVVLLSAFAALLGRISQERELLVTVSATGQPMMNASTLVGQCISMLPLPIAADLDRSFAAHLADVRRRLLDAVEHQRSYLAAVVQARQNGVRTPDATVMFNLDRPVEVTGFEPASAELLPVPGRYAKFDLSLNAIDIDGSVRLEFEYRTDLFDSATVEGWSAQFVALLQRLADAPDADVGELLVAPDTASRDERPGLPADRSDTADLVSIFARQAQRDPTAPAIVAGNAALTYGELDRLASAFAEDLRASGAEPGRIVALDGDGLAEAAVCLLGVLKAGGAFAQVGERAGGDRRALAGVGTIVVARRGLKPTIETTGVAARVGRRQRARLQAACAVYGGVEARLLLSHEAVAAHCRAIANRLRLSPGDRFSHVGGSVVDLLEGLLPALLAGATVVDGPSAVPDPETLCEHIEKHGVTALDIALGLWRRLRHQVAGRDLTSAASSLRCLVRGNVAATALQLARWCPRLFDRSVVSYGYRPGTWPIVIGMTGVSTDVTGARSFPLVDVIESTVSSIRDARMRPTLPGAVGELCLGAAADDEAPPHRTGIRARRLFDGRLQLLGSLDAPRIVAVDRLSLLEDGEIDEPRLPAGETEDVEVSHEPRGEVEEQLASIWRRLLNVARIGSRDNFFELGGHSLVAIALAAEVRSAFAVPLTLRELFDAPTIAQMGALIAARRAAPLGPVADATALVRVAPDPGAADQSFPLTDVQQAYWVGRTGAFGLGNVATHAYYEVDTTDLDVDRFADAWRGLIARHGMLRAVILPHGQQQVLPDVPPYQIATSDLTGLDPDAAAARLDTIRERMSHQVLPSDRWPLFEIHAARLDAARVRLYFSLDALILDAWSMQILFRELSCLYQDPAAGLPPLEVSFRDYMMAHRELERSSAFRDAQEYWAARRTTLPPAPDLPLARDPASIDKPRFVRWSGRLNPETWAQLKARASRSSMTPSIVLLAAYAEVLAMWSRSPQFAINLTLFNRLPLHPQVNDLVGDFTSVTLLAVDGQAAGSFAERARRVQERFWEDLDHHLVSGVRVLRDLARARNDTSGLQMPVVFTSSLIHGQERVDETPMAWLGRVVYSVTQTPQVWLDHEVYEDGLSLVFTWDVVADLFPDGVVQSMFDAFATLLQRLASGDEWWDAPWPYVHRRLLPASQADVVSRANATEAPVSTALLQTLFADRARTQPERPAIVTSARSMSYGELEQRANRIGRSLRRMGAQPNTCVAVMIAKGWEQVVAVLGVLNAGAAYLPIDPALPPERVTSLLAQAEVSLVVTAQRTDGAFPWPSHIRRIAVDRDDVQEVDAGPLDPVQTPDDLAYVIFTSGSTGEPKGVMIDHRGAVNTILDVNRRYGVGPDDRVLALSSLSFDLSVWDIFGLLAAGGSIVFPDDGATRNPAHWVSLMSRARVTIWNSVPALMQMLVEYSDAAAAFTAGLRLVLMSGDWIPVGLPDRIRALGPDVRLVSLGGATEASIWSILYDIETVDESWTSIPYGRPMANQTWHILDGALEPRPVWTPGQLYIGGIGVAKGYWRDEARTRASFITHPRTGERLYRTGDVGRWLLDGTIEFLGREDTQVKVQGHRIELGEIESILAQHPSVRSAVVAAVGARTGEKRLVAYVVPESEPGSGGDGPACVQGPSDVAAAIADPIAQLRFKLSEPGLRADRERPGITLPAVNLGTADLTSAYIERRSYRSFAGERLRLEQIAELVSCLRQWRVPGAPLPKYRYGSAGSLYAVQLYAYVKPAAVEGLDAGTYYYDPRDHRLLPLTGAVDGVRDIYQPNDRATFDHAGFGLFLVGDVGVIERLYAGEAMRFALIETGLMTQLLEMSAPECGIGLCQIGRTDCDRVRPLFALDDGHILLNALIGGAIRPSQRSVAAFLDEMAGLQPLIAAAQAASERDERPAATIDLRTVWRTWLERKVPAYMVPSEYITMEALPLSGNGKVDRKALPVPRESDERPRSGFVAARTDLERQLVHLLQDILGVERIGVHDSFFELGGNSVHLVQFHNRLEPLIGRKIPITAVFQHVTLSALSDHLVGVGPAAPADRSQAVATGTQRLAQLLQRRGQ